MGAKLHQIIHYIKCESPASEINVVAIRSDDEKDVIVSKSIKVPMSHAPVDRSAIIQLAIIYLSRKVSKLKFIKSSTSFQQKIHFKHIFDVSFKNLLLLKNETFLNLIAYLPLSLCKTNIDKNYP
ncbi:hypothetical protein T10_1857 [Trichinella papuae]|uniref:Uncharacterized protein n=1 Tax=Trichinella papuae TaxID=268474 RepID=A0A0V1MQU6_9BILA|nr:hypothetical protein T10_1857 [Trichinella papuae]